MADAHTYPLHVYRIANINQQILSGDNNGRERTNPTESSCIRTHPQKYQTERCEKRAHIR